MAAGRTLATLRFFAASPQGPESDTTGYKGFYYHFLAMESGRRAGASELSTIDTTLLLAGMLTAAAYYDGGGADEREIRALVDVLYRRVNWQWARNGAATVSHGWTPEGGFLPYRWQGYNEGLILYLLGLGSPTYPLPAESYAAWQETYRWRRVYDIAYLHAGPLFTHQFLHLWCDCRGLQAAFMREQGLDYFENSRRATYIQQQYAIHNPQQFAGYGEHAWGLTAGDGPGDATRLVDGRERRFFGYDARGVPDGPDDGTLAPWVVVAALPFAPELVLPTIRYLDARYPAMTSKYGFKCSINPTFPAEEGVRRGWISDGYYGLDQGPVVLMIENYRSRLLWRLIARCSYLGAGLRWAGFTGGWQERRAGRSPRVECTERTRHARARYRVPLLGTAALIQADTAMARLRLLLGISVFWLPLSMIYDGLNTLVLPSQIATLIDATSRATVLGLITVAGLLAGMVVHPAAGIFSDRTRARWGRRGPLVLGTLLAVLALGGLALSASLPALPPARHDRPQAGPGRGRKRGGRAARLRRVAGPAGGQGL